MTGCGQRARPGTMMPVVALAALMLPSPGHAQNGAPGLFPAESPFEVPVAAPREPRFSASLVSTDLLEHARASGRIPDGSDAERESQVAVALGSNLRLWRPVVGAGGGIVLGIQTGVFARFRMDSANQLLATDWLVGVPVEARNGRLSGRARFLHWSAHLGDEFLVRTGAERHDFTFEAVDLLAAWDAGSVRFYGGGSRVLRSQLADAEGAPEDFSDEATLQVGADGRWYPWREGTLGVRAGLDIQWADRADWRGQVAGTAALEARRGGRALRLGLSFFDGPSSLGQFFQDRESLWGLMIRIEL